MYDVRPLLNQGGVFSELKQPSVFRSVHSWHGTVQWVGGQDICPDTLYEDSVPLRVFETAMVRETKSKYTAKTGRGTKKMRKLNEFC